MKNILIAFCVLMCFVFLTENMSAQTNPTKIFENPDRVRYDGSCMTIDNKDIFVYSAAFHYFRCPEELWRDRFQKIKEVGFNTVETYVPWNWHERSMPRDLKDNSNFDFSDLRRWLTMAQEEFDLYTIVRPGPFICAEFSGGGYPRWLAKFRPEILDEQFWLRSANNKHVAWSAHWFDAICKELIDEQVTRKPKGDKGICTDSKRDNSLNSLKERLQEMQNKFKQSISCLESLLDFNTKQVMSDLNHSFEEPYEITKEITDKEEKVYS